MTKKGRVKKDSSSGRLQRTIIGLLLALIMIGSAITAMMQLLNYLPNYPYSADSLIARIVSVLPFAGLLYCPREKHSQA